LIQGENEEKNKLRRQKKRKEKRRGEAKEKLLGQLNNF
jgi:hypothetical protein